MTRSERHQVETVLADQRRQALARPEIRRNLQIQNLGLMEKLDETSQQLKAVRSCFWVRLGDWLGLV